MFARPFKHHLRQRCKNDMSVLGEGQECLQRHLPLSLVAENISTPALLARRQTLWLLVHVDGLQGTFSQLLTQPWHQYMWICSQSHLVGIYRTSNLIIAWERECFSLRRNYITYYWPKVQCSAKRTLPIDDKNKVSERQTTQQSHLSIGFMYQDTN